MSSLDSIVAIIDDDKAVRDSVAALLRARGTLCRTFDCGAAFLASHDLTAFSCILLDVRMENMGGFDVLRAYRRRGGAAPVIILTAQRDLDSAIQAIRSGASDFLTKPYDPDDLVRRIGAMMVGPSDKRTPTRLTAIPEELQRAERLTDREREVFGMLLDGHSAKAIANILGISPRTIEIHRSRIMEKMEARSLADLLRIGLSFPSETFVPVKAPAPRRTGVSCR